MTSVKQLALGSLFLVANVGVLCGQVNRSSTVTSESRFSVDWGPDGTPSQAQLEQLRKSVAYVMEISETELVGMVPKESRGIRWTTCPHCRIRSRSANWKWEPHSPHEVTCEDCNTVFPNVRYPEEKFVEIAAPEGMHRFAYYEETAPAREAGNQSGPKVIRRFFCATADYRAKCYLTERALELATLYEAIGEDRYAHRAFLILSEFARVFPGYPAVFDGEWMDAPVRFIPYNRLSLEELQHNDRTARWEYWSVMDVSMELLTAYERLRNWPHWKTLEGKVTAQTIEQDLFGEQIKHTLRFPENYAGNMSITVKWPSLLRAARVLRQPALFHETFQKVEHFLDTAFLYDGGWWETSPSYAQQIVSSGLARIPMAANGYSDPPGYSDPKTHKRFDDLNLHKIPAFVRAENVLAETRLPDGRLLPINDTWPIGRSAAGSRVETKSALFPGFGVAVLGAGRREAQIHAWLNFTPGVSHKHADALSIGLFFGGKELLSDLGYTHSRYRAWAVSTAAHNTVVVNGRDSFHDISYCGNQVKNFVSDGHHFHLAAVESKSAYENITDQYARTLALIGVNARDCYLVDVFDVRGGEQHDFLLHGSADEDSRAFLSGVPLEPFEGSLLNAGVNFVVPAHQNASSEGAESAYGFVHNLRRGIGSNSTVKHRIELVQDPAVGLHTHLIADHNDQFFLGEAPSIRRIGGAHLREDESQLDRFKAPLLCWRRNGEALVSRFIAVHEPKPADASISSVSATTLKPGVLLLRIDRGDAGTDYFLMSDTEVQTIKEVQTPDGLLSFQGAHGWLRVKQSKVIEALLMGRGQLRLDAFEIVEDAGRFTGKIRAMDEPDDLSTSSYFDVDESLPEDGNYSTIVLTFADGTERVYNVTGVGANGSSNGSRIRVRETAGFAVKDGILKFQSYPQRTLKDVEVTYTLSTWKR